KKKKPHSSLYFVIMTALANKKSYRALIALGMALGLFVASAHAQNKKDTLISGDFLNLSFSAFANQIEERTPYHFYYDPAAVDTIRIEISADRQSLASLLHQILSNTRLRFAIDDQKKVYITAGIALRTHLPEHFFDTSGVKVA